MRLNDLLPPPVPSISTTGSMSVDVVRLRAALRLMLSADEADHLAQRLPQGAGVNDLVVVVRGALDRLRLQRLLARLPWRSRDGAGLILGAESRVPAESAVALALSIGLHLDSRRLADIMDIRIETAGRWLLAGRRALDPEIPDACQRTAGLVGRYDDRSLDPDERIELFTHLSRCPTCQVAVERSRSVDAEIADEVERFRVIVGGEPVRRPSRLGPVRQYGLPLAMSLVLLVALLVSWTVISRLVHGSHNPVPLVAARAPTPYGGWLLIERGDGTVHARHLTTGEVRQIIGSENEFSRSWTQLMLSPDGTRLLAFYGDFSQERTGRVVVYALDGQEVAQLEWPIDGAVYYPTGWFNEHEILVIALPSLQPNQTDEANRERYNNETHFLKIDVETGASREILRGGIAYGLPSPDGRYLAVARMTNIDSPMASRDGLALEIWALTADDVEGPIVTYDNWVPTGGVPIWAPDGSRIFTVQTLQDAEDSPSVTDQRTIPNYSQHVLVAIGLDGTVQELVSAGGDSAVFPVSVSPDGTTVIYHRSEGANVLPAVSYWRVSADGGEPEQLSTSVVESYGRYGVAWSPDGATLLVSEVVAPYLDPEHGDWSRWDAAATDLVAIAADGARTTLLSSFSVGDQLLGWVADDAMPEGASNGAGVRFTAPERIPNVPNATQLGQNSVASRDGNYVTLDDLAVGSPLIWSLNDGDTQRLRGSLEDVAWLPGATGLITVSGVRPEAETASQLSVLATTNPYAPSAFEQRHFDPVELAVGDGRRYAAPRPSPNGLNTAFFIVSDSGRVELWLANAVGGPTQMARWSTPSDRIIESPLVADWVDNRTLVFVEPGEWSNGLPEVAIIRRVTVAEDGSAEVEDVLELVGRGDDRGVVVTELAISNDGKDVAWRLRHFTALVADNGRFDTISLAPVEDLTRDFEVDRGAPSDGLAWSANSRLLLVGLSREVMVVDVPTVEIQVISGDDSAQHPLWVHDNEIWYAGEDGAVMRVRLQYE